jgi:hypothetical protein
MTQRSVCELSFMCHSALELAQIMLVFVNNTELLLFKEGAAPGEQPADPAGYNNVHTIPSGTEADLWELSLASLEMYKTLMQTGVIVDRAQASASSRAGGIRGNNQSISTAANRRAADSTTSSTAGATPAEPTLVQPLSLLASDYAQRCIAVCAAHGLNTVTWLPRCLMSLFKDQEQPLSSERPMTGGGTSGGNHHGCSWSSRLKRRLFLVWQAQEAFVSGLAGSGDV